MKTVNILESSDTVDATDWCRPLELISMSGGMSDGYSFRSCYGGTPENNSEWVRVKHVLGKCWFGKTVATLNKELTVRYEFVRGDIPNTHKLNMRGYNSCSA